MSMGKRHRVNGGENAVFSRYARGITRWAGRAGVATRIKRGARRRERREGKQQIRQEST